MVVATIEAATQATPVKARRSGSSRPVVAEVDLVRSYLRDIGRVPLLSHQQEITLGRQVQELMELEALESELKDQLGDDVVPAAELASTCNPKGSCSRLSSQS